MVRLFHDSPWNLIRKRKLRNRKSLSQAEIWNLALPWCFYLYIIFAALFSKFKYFLHRFFFFYFVHIWNKTWYFYLFTLKRIVYFYVNQWDVFTRMMKCDKKELTTKINARIFSGLRNEWVGNLYWCFNSIPFDRDHKRKCVGHDMRPIGHNVRIDKILWFNFFFKTHILLVVSAKNKWTWAVTESISIESYYGSKNK